MTAEGLLQIGLFLLVLAALALPLGKYMARVYGGRPCGLDRVLGPLERGLYRLAGVRPDEEMGWREYAFALLLFSAAGVFFLYLLLRLQGLLPLNPQGLAAVPSGAALDAAVSAVTDSRWPGRADAVPRSHLTWMLGLAAQSFLSAAAGMALLAAALRGVARRSAAAIGGIGGIGGIGNFWVDLTRGTLYILLPLALLLAPVLVSQGAVQTLAGARAVPLLDPVLRRADLPPQTAQLLPLGPAASQAAARSLTRSGDSFFGNAAHPFEVPAPLALLLLVLARTAIPAALCITCGTMVGNARLGWALLAALLLALGAFELATYHAAAAGNPRLTAMSVDQIAGDAKLGGDMEGKEVRAGAAGSALAAVAATALVTPLERAGAGLSFLVMLLLVAASQGKRIEARELKIVALLSLVLLLLVPLGLLAGATAEPGRQILGALAMLISRFWVAVPILAAAGSLANKS
jgi:K+-transporting ATPase ATPase A chain